MHEIHRYVDAVVLLLYIESVRVFRVLEIN